VAAVCDRSSDDSVLALRERIADLERQIRDISRHNQELREAIQALLAPSGRKPDGTEA
jgi:chaperonin cofactor prefoldin